MEFKNIIYKGTELCVSDTGIIKQDGKEKNIYMNHDGYPVCSIKTENGWRSVGIHRLIALAFIPNPDNLAEVNHKDYDRKNFNIDNLEWISHEDNVRYSICNMPDKTGNKNPNYKNNTLKLKYENDKELSKEKQSRPGLQNGRCRKITLLYDDVIEKTFDYIEECCEYIRRKYATNVKSNDSIRGRINDCIRKNKKYLKHLSFIKE